MYIQLGTRGGKTRIVTYSNEQNMKVALKEQLL